MLLVLCSDNYLYNFKEYCTFSSMVFRETGEIIRFPCPLSQSTALRFEGVVSNLRHDWRSSSKEKITHVSIKTTAQKRDICIFFGRHAACVRDWCFSQVQILAHSYKAKIVPLFKTESWRFINNYSLRVLPGFIYFLFG